MDTAERNPGSALGQQLAETFHRQHVEATGRLLASVAQDVRSALASIVYSADFLDERAALVSEDVLRATTREIGEAGRRLALTVDSLLDYAGLGPAIAVPVSLREVMSRVQSLLRTFYRDGAHGLRIELASGADWVRGNPVVVEQIFANLLLSVAECAAAPSQVTVSSQSAPSTPGVETAQLQVFVRAAGARCPAGGAPGLGSAHEPDPFRLTIADAHAAALAQGGRLTFAREAESPCFIVCLPRSEGPR